MTGTVLAQVLINGLEVGLLYALIAVGFSLIYGVGRIIFCAHGEIYMMGGILTYFLVMKQGIPFPLVLVFLPLVIGVFAIIIDRLLFRHFYGNDFAVFIVSLALGIVIANSFLQLFGGSWVGVRDQIPGDINILGVSLPLDKLVVALISIAIILALNFFFHRVKAGQAMRAVAQDPEAAALQGISMNRVLPLTFFLALGIAAVAGVLMAPLYSVNSGMGSAALLNTFIVVILGGVGSFPGAIAGGLFLGILHSLGGLFIGQLTFLVAFAVIIIFLVVRPQGFFGRK